MNYNRITFVAFIISFAIFSSWFIIQYYLKNQSVESAIDPGQIKKDVVYDGCLEGFDLYSSGYFSLCYPFKMTSVDTTESSTSAELFKFFRSETEELRISNKVIQPVPIHLCNFEETINIASLSAKRVSMKQESVAGCGKSYRYVTTLNSDPPIVIDYQKNQGVFDLIENMEIIENSFTFQNQEVLK